MLAVYVSPRRVMYSKNTRKPGRGAPEFQKEPYQIGCENEGLRIRTDGLRLGFVDRREGSVVHCHRKTGQFHVSKFRSIANFDVNERVKRQESQRWYHIRRRHKWQKERCEDQTVNKETSKEATAGYESRRQG